MSQNKSLAIQFAIASTVFLSLAPAQPASAQILELATGALSILNSVIGPKPQSAPQPVAPPVVIPQQTIPSSPDFTVGAGNFNGNSLNLCVSGCLPNGTPANAPIPNTVVNTFPPAVQQPGTPLPPQTVPNRPVLTIPPVALPVNLN
ncbi:MAG TPA: hypothetical protein V6C71_23005 [Coleofasciculaceae cyanobacterium]